MKNILILIVLFLGVTSVAQEAPEMAKYDAKNAANIFYYNYFEVPEKIKVKDDVLKAKVFKSLRSYNDKIKNISFLNFQKLQDLEVTVNSLGKQLYTNADLRNKIRVQIETTILPIRDSIGKIEKVLNSDFEEILSRRQYKKWIKYQKAQKRKLLPETPKTTSARAPSNITSRGLGGGRRF